MPKYGSATVYEIVEMWSLFQTRGLNILFSSFWCVFFDGGSLCNSDGGSSPIHWVVAQSAAHGTAGEVDIKKRRKIRLRLLCSINAHHLLFVHPNFSKTCILLSCCEMFVWWLQLVVFPPCGTWCLSSTSTRSSSSRPAVVCLAAVTYRTLSVFYELFLNWKHLDPETEFLIVLQSNKYN